VDRASHRGCNRVPANACARADLAQTCRWFCIIISVPLVIPVPFIIPVSFVIPSPLRHSRAEPAPAKAGAGIHGSGDTLQ